MKIFSAQILKAFFERNKKKVILVFSVIFLLLIGSFLFKPKPQTVSDVQIPEVELFFDAEGPYALLYPRKDGNALILNLKRTASYDNISYELAYTSNSDEATMQGNKKQDDGELPPVGGSIDRGVMGTIDTKSKKGEYEQEILFGTCSKQVCKYDQGVENGTLTLHIRKGEQAYKMITQWHIQKPEVALGLLSSGDGHFNFKVKGDTQALVLLGFSIVNDLSGLPKLPGGKTVSGKVYSLNVPITKVLSGGEVSIELSEAPGKDSKIFRYDFSLNKWVEYETKIDGSKLTANVDGGGIFAVLSPSK